MNESTVIFLKFIYIGMAICFNSEMSIKARKSCKLFWFVNQFNCRVRGVDLSLEDLES